MYAIAAHPACLLLQAHVGPAIHLPTLLGTIGGRYVDLVSSIVVDVAWMLLATVVTRHVCLVPRLLCFLG